MPPLRPTLWSTATENNYYIIYIHRIIINIDATMKINFKNITILSLLAMVLVMMSCGGEKKRKDGRTDTTTQGEISFCCDESFSPIIDELIDVYQMQCPNTKLKPIYTNEIDGINMLLQQKTWLTITARNFTPKEYTYIKDGLDMLPEAVPLAYDGMALICSNQNLDSCISVKDVKDILLGKKTKWSEVNPGSKLGEIWVCFDNRKSSAVNYCCDSILGGKPIDSPNVFAAKDSKDVIDYVSKTPIAIGVIGSNWLNDKRDTTNTTWNKAITVMSVSKLDHASPQLVETLPGVAPQWSLSLRAYHIRVAQRPEARTALGLCPLH